MAYTAASSYSLVRPWQFSRNRYIHRSVSMTVDGSGDATGTITVPGPGRIIAVQYGIKSAPDIYGAATSGALTLNDAFDAVQLFTDADLSSVQDGFIPVGAAAVDEAHAATAATDGFSGGFPYRGGSIDAVIASGTEAELITVDVLVRLCTYARVVLRGVTSSATVRLGNAGVLAAVAVDYGSGITANTLDLTIKADDATDGTTLWTRANADDDFGPKLVGRPGADEAKAATAATDGTEAGNGFKRQLIVSGAQGETYVDSTDEAIVELWIDD